jgi:hypothetical protein
MPRGPKKVTEHRLSPDNIVDDKLSIVLGNIESLLKPYQHTTLTSVQRINNAPTEIVIIATIKM